ncbi:hypothetical protein OROGR_001379 [Orobanche gracilis]
MAKIMLGLALVLYLLLASQSKEWSWGRRDVNSALLVATVTLIARHGSAHREVTRTVSVFSKDRSRADVFVGSKAATVE